MKSFWREFRQGYVLVDGATEADAKAHAAKAVKDILGDDCDIYHLEILAITNTTTVGTYVDILIRVVEKKS